LIKQLTTSAFGDSYLLCPSYWVHNRKRALICQREV